ncbi:hypothetical protein NMG60_11006414 [Bertholletia excelsa]
MTMTEGGSKVSGPSRPTISLPPRASMEALFAGVSGFSPGPMTLVSNFFSDNFPDADCRSFSQLLAGAMASPVSGAATPKLPEFVAENNASSEVNFENKGDRNLGFKQNRPVNLVIAHSPLFMIPPGVSPSGLLNSPGFFSPLQSPFGMTHQQALAQVTAQAALSQSYMQIQAEQPSSVAASGEPLTNNKPLASDLDMQQVHSVVSEPESSIIESSEVSQSERKSLPVSIGKPTNDGYNWRKYGQKQVKASEYPRSYYRCTHPGCPVKKKVERNLDGQITEIIYRGQHNHELPQSNKRIKDGVHTKPSINSQARSEPGLQGEIETSWSNEISHSVPGIDLVSIQPIPLELPLSNDDAELGEDEARLNEDDDDDEPNPKRRNTEVEASELTSSLRTVTESKIIVQTRSEVDLLDDGYKWRKYGQKVVKGNAHPRSYYKCTYIGCNVRKHVERSSSDSKAVVTTYEGKHNHDIPGARKSSQNVAGNRTSQSKPQRLAAKKPALLEDMDFGNKDQTSVRLQLKEEQIKA